MTFDQCVEEKKLPDCVFNEGSGYLLQKAQYIYIRTVSSYPETS